MVDEQTRNYELMMIISPEANETEIDAASARVAGFIADRGGLIYEQSNWGLRRLAYPIQKFQEGNYVLTRFALGPGEIIELDSSLKASDDVMRHLTMKLDKSVKVEVPEPEPEPEPETAEDVRRRNWKRPRERPTSRSRKLSPNWPPSLRRKPPQNRPPSLRQKLSPNWPTSPRRKPPQNRPPSPMRKPPRKWKRPTSRSRKAAASSRPRFPGKSAGWLRLGTWEASFGRTA